MVPGGRAGAGEAPQEHRLAAQAAGPGDAPGEQEVAPGDQVRHGAAGVPDRHVAARGPDPLPLAREPLRLEELDGAEGGRVAGLAGVAVGVRPAGVLRDGREGLEPAGLEQGRVRRGARRGAGRAGGGAGLPEVDHGAKGGLAVRAEVRLEHLPPRVLRGHQPRPLARARQRGPAHRRQAVGVGEALRGHEVPDQLRVLPRRQEQRRQGVGRRRLLLQVRHPLRRAGEGGAPGVGRVPGGGGGRRRRGARGPAGARRGGGPASPAGASPGTSRGCRAPRASAPPPTAPAPPAGRSTAPGSPP